MESRVVSTTNMNAFPALLLRHLEEIYVRARKFEKMRLNIAPSQDAFTGGSE